MCNVTTANHKRSEEPGKLMNTSVRNVQHMAHSFKLNFAQCKLVNVNWKIGKDKIQKKKREKNEHFSVYLHYNTQK